jgi:hypothetical protein
LTDRNPIFMAMFIGGTVASLVFFVSFATELSMFPSNTLISEIWNQINIINPILGTIALFVGVTGLIGLFASDLNEKVA